MTGVGASDYQKLEATQERPLFFLAVATVSPVTQKRPKLGRNQLALEDALLVLAVGREHGPLVESARSLAFLVDQPGFDDKLWREYRLALQNLMRATGDGGSDAFNQYLESLRAEVGDPSEA